MQDNISVIVATILAVIILVLFPVYNVATRQDSIANNVAVKVTTNFVDEVRNKGYITEDAYQTFVNEINSTGNSYDIEMEIHKPTLLTTENSDEDNEEYEEHYIIDYTDTILKKMQSSTEADETDNSVIKRGVCYLKEGYKFYVRIKNTNTTQAQLLMARLFGGKFKERIVINYGGDVYSNEWAQSEKAQSITSKISISRPLDMAGKEFKYQEFISGTDPFTGEIITVYGIVVRLNEGEKFKFELKYTDVMFYNNGVKIKTKAERENHVKEYFETLGFTANVTVTEKSETMAGEKGTYVYTITLSDIQNNYGAPNVKGKVQVKDGSAESGGSSIGQVVSKEFILVYDKPKKITIPEEFTPSIFPGEMTIEEGFVIYETTAEELKKYTQQEAQETFNQYVWVPVNGELNIRTDRGGAINEDYIMNADSGMSEDVKHSIEMYGGFYIGRYEAGYEGEIGLPPTNASYRLMSKKGAYPWIGYYNTSLTESAYIASPTVSSHLVYGLEWDAVMTWMEDIPNVTDASKRYINDSTNMGWSRLQDTGKDMPNSANKVKNIYDMAGNLWELTNEYFYNMMIKRGGGITHSFVIQSANSQLWGSNNNFYGLRVVLCIKTNPYPIIPEGFTVSRWADENTVAGGLVIYETTQEELKKYTQQEAQRTFNQYVWIPVNGKIRQYNWEWIDENRFIDNYNDFGYDQNIEGSINANIKKYGGFYIGRYEAGKPTGTALEGGTTIGLDIDGTDKPVCIKGAEPWNNIPLEAGYHPIHDEGDGCTLVAKKAYEDSTSVTSHSVSGAEWDAITQFVRKEKDIFDSSNWGDTNWYIKNIQLTGYSEKCKAKNIYDLVGNLLEFTQETYPKSNSRTHNYVLIRGQSGSGSNIKPSMTTRTKSAFGYYNNETRWEGYNDTGFRVVLCIK